MRKQWFTEEWIIAVLKEAEAKTTDVCCPPRSASRPPTAGRRGPAEISEFQCSGSSRARTAD